MMLSYDVYATAKVTNDTKIILKHVFLNILLSAYGLQKLHARHSYMQGSSVLRRNAPVWYEGFV